MVSHPHSQLVDENGILIVVDLDLSQPVGISDFVSAFAGLGGQSERHIKAEHPDLEGDVRVYQKEVRKGPIEAELIPLAYSTIIMMMGHHQIATKFVSSLARKVALVSAMAGRFPNGTKSELNEIVDTIAAFANVPKGKAKVSAVKYPKQKTSRFSIKLLTRDAQTALQ